MGVSTGTMAARLARRVSAVTEAMQEKPNCFTVSLVEGRPEISSGIAFLDHTQWGSAIVIGDDENGGILRMVRFDANQPPHVAEGELLLKSSSVKRERLASGREIFMFIQRGRGSVPVDAIVRIMTGAPNIIRTKTPHGIHTMSGKPVVADYGHTRNIKGEVIGHDELRLCKNDDAFGIIFANGDVRVLKILSGQATFGEADDSAKFKQHYEAVLKAEEEQRRKIWQQRSDELLKSDDLDVADVRSFVSECEFADLNEELSSAFAEQRLEETCALVAEARNNGGKWSARAIRAMHLCIEFGGKGFILSSIAEDLRKLGLRIPLSVENKLPPKIPKAGPPSKERTDAEIRRKNNRKKRHDAQPAKGPILQGPKFRGQR